MGLPGQESRDEDSVLVNFERTTDSESLNHKTRLCSRVSFARWDRKDCTGAQYFLVSLIFFFIGSNCKSSYPNGKSFNNFMDDQKSV